MASLQEQNSTISTRFNTVTHGKKSDTATGGKRTHRTQTATHGNSDHITKHVMKLTRNLLVLQKEGICCDVTVQCKDGIIPAHSGGPPSSSPPSSSPPSSSPLSPSLLPSPSSSSASFPLSSLLLPSLLPQNLLVLQKEGICCDVTLQCKDGIIPAHSGEFPSLCP